ncbi:hypothetical protein EDB81DRAFT_953612 [Dactylonectria macrodidyma]|uniref:Extracellular membrane protein CFEM domain-containing protein n=1 Tax=Dactylonectria macrodidyma TaxID=307937 RepID=A0A9P9D4R0_9HYPO|nr:hypothetical protein EDB81DRAFT_953612 [Dactylonectria macrodidyma]
MIPSRPLCLIFFGLPFVLAAPDDPQSISSEKVYTSLRRCAKDCFWGWNGGPVDHIGNVNGCDYEQGEFAAMNKCYCRTDLQSLGQRYLTTCVSSGCDTIGGYTNDLSTAASLYENYCLSQGFTAVDPATVSAETTTDKPSATLASDEPITAPGDSYVMTATETVVSTMPADSSSTLTTQSKSLVSLTSALQLSAELGLVEYQLHV